MPLEQLVSWTHWCLTVDLNLVLSHQRHVLLPPQVNHEYIFQIVFLSYPDS